MLQRAEVGSTGLQVSSGSLLRCWDRAFLVQGHWRRPQMLAALSASLHCL